MTHIKAPFHPAPRAEGALGISTEFAAPAKINNLRYSATAQAVSLGIKNQSANSRAERFSLQATAQVVCNQIGRDVNPPKPQKPLISDRVTYCCSRPDGKALIKQYTDVKRAGKSYFAGLRVCSNQWLCPVCSQLISEFRSDEVREAIDWAKSDQYRIVEMHTLTVRHSVDDDFAQLLKGMRKAWGWFTSHKACKSIKSHCGYIGYIRAVEITHGKNGWHPHFHILFFSKTGLKDHQERLALLWQTACEKAGLPIPDLEHGYDVRDGTEAGAYISKYATDSKLDSDSREHVITSKGTLVTWDSVDEMSKWHSKKGRDGNLTPFDFLRKLRLSFVTGEDRESVPYYKDLFKQYALGTRGMSRLQWSPGFKDLVGIDHVDDDDVIEQMSFEQTKIHAVIPEEFWHLAFKAGSRDNREELLRASEKDGWGGVAMYLYDVLDKEQPGQLTEQDRIEWFCRMKEEIEEYDQTVNAAGRKDWQVMYPVSSERVADSPRLRAEMSRPIDYYKAGPSVTKKRRV